MFDRAACVLSVLLLGAGALVGLQFSSATFTDGSSTPTQVSAARDWTAPTVSVDDPGAVIQGVVSLTATAADAATTVQNVEIQFRRQGSTPWESLCVDADGSPWDCTWDTETVNDGTYELRAIATDEDGNAETSATVGVEVFNTSGVVIDPTPTPVRGTVRLTAHMVNVGSGSSRITFQITPTGAGSWTDLPGCTSLTGPEASCDFDTTLRDSGTTYDLRAVGRKGPHDYYDVQAGIVVDNTAPSVTVDQAVGQADPTNGSTINYAVVFSEPVTGFEAADLALGGTSGGTRSATVTGSATTYNVAVTGMSGFGTVTASLPSGRVADAAGNTNTSSTSTDNSVVHDGAPTTVTINQAAGQPDPTNGVTVNFTVVFNRPVTGFTASDVTLGGTVGGTRTRTVTGSGTTYNVAVTDMLGSGTLVGSIAAGVVTDAYGGTNVASTSTDNTVVRDVTAPTVTVEQGAGQADPTNGSSISFRVVFSEPVTGFVTGDVSVAGSAGATTASVTGSGTTYDVAVSGMNGSGTVIATIAAGVAMDAVGNGNAASTSTDNTVTRDVTAPTVTVRQASDQADPTSGSTIRFTVAFSEAVTGFDASDVTLSGTAAGSTGATVTGSGATYTVTVTGMTVNGSVTAAVGADRATDPAGNHNTASPPTGPGVDNTVTYSDTTKPTLKIEQAVGQADPATGTTIYFTAVFSEPVTGFQTDDVAVGGRARGNKVGTVTAISSTTYTIAVTGMTSAGTVEINVAAGRAFDAAGNASSASTSTDNSVYWSG